MTYAQTSKKNKFKNSKQNQSDRFDETASSDTHETQDVDNSCLDQGENSNQAKNTVDTAQLEQTKKELELIKQNLKTEQEKRQKLLLQYANLQDVYQKTIKTQNHQVILRENKIVQQSILEIANEIHAINANPNISEDTRSIFSKIQNKTSNIIKRYNCDFIYPAVESESNPEYHKIIQMLPDDHKTGIAAVVKMGLLRNISQNNTNQEMVIEPAEVVVYGKPN